MDTSGYISIAETELEGIIQPTWRYMVCYYNTILFYCSNQVFNLYTNNMSPGNSNPMGPFVKTAKAAAI